MATKIRAQVNLPEEVIWQIDETAGPRKRSEFLERAALAQLRREAFDRWMKLGDRFKGLTLEDIYYPSRNKLEKCGGSDMRLDLLRSIFNPRSSLDSLVKWVFYRFYPAHQIGAFQQRLRGPAAGEDHLRLCRFPI